MKHLLCLLIATLLATALPATTAADGWPQARGHGYYKLGFRMIRAHHFYEPDGTRIPIPTLADYTASFYGEYGITDRLTVIAYVPFLERITLNNQVGRPSGTVYVEGDAVTSVADADVGIRLGLWRGGGTVVSAGLKVGVPIGTQEQKSGLLTGDGEANQRLTLEAGHSFYPFPAYAAATIGYDNRLNGFSDEVVYALEAGYQVHPSLLVIARLRGLSSLENGDAGVHGGMGGLYANNQRYLSYGLEVAYTRGQGGLSLGIDGATLARNVLAAPAFSVGVFVVR